jgi:EamA domain-containing membrane protein RarD
MRILFSLILSFFVLVSFSQTIRQKDTLMSKKDTVTVIGVGDIMMGSNYPLPVLPPNDGAFLMKEVESTFCATRT